MLKVAAGTPLLDVIALAYQANQPILLHGNHGVGKTQLLEQAAQKLKIGFLVRDLSLMEPPDLVGIPRIQSDGRTHYAPPAFLPRNGRGLIVFEELNRCPRYMQAPCLQLLTARTLNDYELPAGWLPCAAINDAGDGYLADELDQALLSRFLRVKVIPNLEQWTEWAHKAAKLHPKIIRFVENSPHVFADPVANPRAWTYASQLYKAWQTGKEKDQDLLLIALAGVLNEKWALAFCGSLSDNKNPLTASQIIDQYPAHQSLVRGWVAGGQLDVVSATLEQVKRHLQKQSNYNQVIETSPKFKNLQSFLDDVPADLKVDFEDWAAGRGFTHFSG